MLRLSLLFAFSLLVSSYAVASYSDCNSDIYDIYSNKLDDQNDGCNSEYSEILDGNGTFYIAMKVSRISNFLVEWGALEISNPESVNYGRYLSLDEISSLVNVSQRNKDVVNTWLTESGLYDVGGEVTWYADACQVTSPRWLIEDLFNIEFDLMYFTGQGVSLFTNDEYELPSDVANVVELIEGLALPPSLKNGRRPAKINMNRYSDQAQVDPGMVTREVMARLYNFSLNMTANNTGLGPMEYQGGNGFSNKGLNKTQLVNNCPLNPVPQNRTIGVVNAPDIESTLDIQMMGMLAPGAQLWYEDSPFWMYAWAVNFLNRQEIPHIVSLSWGWSERDQCSIATCNATTSKQYVARANYEFAKLALRGVTIVVASGDAGSPGRTNEGCDPQSNHINPVFPGSSPWVTSVGATYLVANNNTNSSVKFTTPICTTEHISCATGTEEQSITQPQVGWTSGSGFTLWTKTPGWQVKQVRNYLNSGVPFPKQRFWNRNGRGYPDVTAVGHNCLTWEGGFWSPVDGTSCSAPVFASLLALLNDYQVSRGKPRIGFANQLLYQMSENQPNTFNDIIVGNSSCTEYACCGPEYGFVATTGWDVVSGLGSPNVENMRQYLYHNT